MQGAALYGLPKALSRAIARACCKQAGRLATPFRAAHIIVDAFMGLTVNVNVVKSLKMTPLKFYSMVCMAFY